MPRKEYRLLRQIQGRPIVEKPRSGDRHRPDYQRPTRTRVKRVSKWERRSIVAWDGEGANLDNGKHVYNLLANSNGEYIIDFQGLSTLAIFDFFMRHSSEQDINVIYGGSYDINMILKDLSFEKLKILWNSGKVYWRGYRIIWATRKKFTIQRIVPTENGSRVDKTFILWDVIGYFQTSFVRACELWLGNLEVLKDIQEMKLKRSSFKSEDIESIIEYNRKECVLLVLLMERLFSSLDEAEIQLMRYDGAGSIAAALLRKNGVKNYKGKIPAVVNRKAQHAYSGGRIEAIKCGTTTTPTKIYRYDINSAYPSACLSLPSYQEAEWRKESYWDGTDNSLVAVTFHFRDKAPFYPLFYRDSNGSITYPQRGRGVYWGPEIANLYRYFQEGIDFEIEWAINCTINDATMPFEFIEELYELRKKFKAEGSMASESLKLGLNSIYGKLVQQAGYREGRIPTYHQLLWGGQITSLTRARLFDVAMQAPGAIISFATDAVFSTSKLDVPIGKELGQWTFDEFNGMTIIQAGVYFLDDQGEWYEKFRGFDKGSLERESIIRAWQQGTKYSATLTRFVGLGSSLMATDFDIWRTWRTDTRSLDITPTGKRVSGVRTDYHKGLRQTNPAPNITPEVVSEPYAIEWIDGIRNSEKQTQDGVPLEVLVDEYEDGEL